ncbi:DEAD/DEAH box helicase [Granulicella sp. 5B5]|uniref:DEAD/DEAH box helicase n=1 Tax=Granulicella sp. 5B5 TaxID=1617967 RepID=UPI0015F40ABB|nr:DEAD/DEAH box helicase [Granulicella sp. 5B5]QMV19276.1 DEAD/DEAH box helicase [Granulicella sp. 5B5]
MASTATTPESLTHTALAWAHPVVQEWFLTKFGSPTEPQIAGWPAILRGDPTLISAPTGSGKTLTAFLVCIDALLRKSIEGRLAAQTEVVYVSPLKALSNDVQKNLDGPLAEIQQLALERGYLCTPIRTGIRTGDTPTKDRTAMLKHPPHILVTTPESLYILLTAGKSRQNLTRVRTLIVDEIHAIADDKRGAHLALSLERLDALVCGENRLSPGAMLTGLATPPQRIGLSATQNPIELVAAFLTGCIPTEVSSRPERSEVERPASLPLSPNRPRQPATIIQVGQRRTLDLAIEVPSDELGSICSTAMWQEIFDKLAALTDHHRSTLVFVNTRKLVEKISFELSQRLGEDAVAAHHGSLSRALRLDAEQRLKSGEIKILIATASLELGIDIGTVDLVCQIATTRSVAVAMQRVGRAGHWRGATPKGRFFATTRDDLMEQAALLRKMTAGELDLLEVPELPIDVLMQQIVAAVGAESWDETALYNVLRRAYPFRNLTPQLYEQLLSLLHNGIESSRGRYGAYILRDRVQGQLHARRGARSIAIGNGGAIPDTSIFAVMLQPENVQIATLDEHFAVDSSPGDVILLGNTSWRIQRVEAAGKVLVEDAHGAPPSIPFWEGEAPQRTSVVSDGVSDLRAEIDQRTRNISPRNLSFASVTEEVSSRPEQDGSIILRSGETCGLPAHDPQVQLLDTIAFLQRECFVCESAARQLIAYIVAGRAVLGCVPTKQTIIAERFFDEGGGQQLILHTPFGGRLNKAWGLALRKRFCRGFNFELQAAATDNGINISLAEQHSFPLADVFHFLTEHTARTLLEQACIPSPLFKNRWRWAAGRSLQLLRMQKGKRVAPQIQRTRSDDLLASVFPHASACPETMTGDIEIPDHPLVNEVMKDTLTEAMDIDGLLEVLRGIASGSIHCVAIDTPVPSVFAHELVNAMPYAFLDEAGTEERRARTTSLRRALPNAITEGAGLLDLAAIATVREQLCPDIRDEHELHDLLLQLVALPLSSLGGSSGLQATETSPILAGASAPACLAEKSRHWPLYFDRLAQQQRTHIISLEGEPTWIAAERLPEAALLWPDEVLPAAPVTTEPKPFVLGGTEDRPAQTFSARDTATTALTQGWLQILGPTTATELGAITHLHPRSLHQAFLAMEMQGLAMRGVFEHPKPSDDEPLHIEWCERRILQRIHRLTLTSLRKQVEPATPAIFMRWLLDWHHLAPDTQLAGEEGVLAVIEQLEGFEAPAVEWERTLLPTRIANYSPQWLDNLSLAGVIGWGRISPHPAWTSASSGTPSLQARVPQLAQEKGGALAPELRKGPRRVIPTNAAPITFYLRDTSDWLHAALAANAIDESILAQALSPEAQQVRAFLAQQGAVFLADLQRLTGLTRLQTSTALWELATAGLAAADGFDQLRAMMDPRRKSVTTEQPHATSLRKRAAARTTAGRWSLLQPATLGAPSSPTVSSSSRVGSQNLPNSQQAAIAAAKQRDAALDTHARILLRRYGVLFRDLLARESNAPKWRDLVPILRRLEARGEIRGGRFVSGPFGEQYALPEAAGSLREARKRYASLSGETPIAVAAADPLNLVGILVPGERVPATPGKQVLFTNGAAVQDALTPTPSPPRAKPNRSRAILDLIRSESSLPRPAARPTTQDLFS